MLNMLNSFLKAYYVDFIRTTLYVIARTHSRLFLYHSTYIYLLTVVRQSRFARDTVRGMKGETQEMFRPIIHAKMTQSVY